MDPSHLMTPREVAEMFGVRTTTVARWARDGRLAATVTPGGHRRYPTDSVRKYLQSLSGSMDPEQEQRELDAVRLYERGWNIRQVAQKFNYSYGTIRCIVLNERRSDISERPDTPITTLQISDT